MLNLLGKALTATLTGVLLDGDARWALEEAGGLASAIQSSADARMIKAAMAAQGLTLVGSTPLTSPRIGALPNPVPVAVRIARAALAQPAAAPAATATPAASVAAYMPMSIPEPAPLPAGPLPAPTIDPADRIPTSKSAPARPRGEALTPERAALLDNAMKVHNAKQSVLAHLSPEQRAMLTSIAMKALFPQQQE